ncbi:MAG TPA: lactonase family protein [Ferruginibacter sp.]|nr:lactonase family protein [Ferruginibacter sp.]
MKRIYFLLSLILLIASGAAAQKTQPAYLLVGTYTAGKGEGIYVYSFNPVTAASKLVSIAKTSNPSFLAVAPGKKTVYAVNENADSTMHTTGGYISAFRFKNGTLTEINKVSSGGNHPCYVAVDKTGNWVFAGNYTSGSIGLIAVKKDGSLDSLKQVVQHSGSGADPVRQKSPHVHGTFLSPDNRYLFVPDLGIDKLMNYTFNVKAGILQPAKIPFEKLSPGSGPRHLDIHPNGKYVYLLLEMMGEVIVYKNAGHANLQEVQTFSSLPPYYKGPIGAADIHVSKDGKFLYCSNRGNANTIGIFSIDNVTGKLTSVGHQYVMGTKPRNFNFSPGEDFLLVANQESNNIVIFKRDKQTGLLTDTGKRIDVPNPACIKWIK